jgi:tetratricopeptide (TPR) repeat protein
LLGVPSEKIHEVVRSKLAIGLDTKPEAKPVETEMLDRYEALIEHSILAGHFKEACDLYVNAMGGDPGHGHLYHIVGDYGRMIRILSLFAEDGEPKNLTPQLSSFDRAYLSANWGLAASALGDLSTAEHCFDLQIELRRNIKDWENLSQGLQNSAWVAMARGAFPSARKLLTESLEYAEADDKYRRWASHGSLAFTCHALGEISEAKKNFDKATEIKGRPLFSVSGIYEAEYIYALGDKKTAVERTKANLTICERNEWPKTISLCNSLLGLHSLPDSMTKARSHLNKVRDWTDRSGHMDCLIRAHILAAEIAYCAGDFPGALTEATTGLNHAKSCGYGRFAIDLLLLLAKINLAIPDARAALGNARKALDRSRHKDCRYAWGQANAGHLCGICHKKLEEPELSKKRLEAALKLREKIQHPGAEQTRKLIKEYFEG